MSKITVSNVSGVLDIQNYLLQDLYDIMLWLHFGQFKRIILRLSVRWYKTSHTFIGYKSLSGLLADIWARKSTQHLHCIMNAEIRGKSSTPATFYRRINPARWRTRLGHVKASCRYKGVKELFPQIPPTSDSPPCDVSGESTSTAPLGRAKTENHFTVHCERGLAISLRAYSTIGWASFTASPM